MLQSDRMMCQSV